MTGGRIYRADDMRKGDVPDFFVFLWPCRAHGSDTKKPTQFLSRELCPRRLAFRLTFRPLAAAYYTSLSGSASGTASRSPFGSEDVHVPDLKTKEK